MCSVEKWSSKSEVVLQDCLASTDWNMLFRNSVDSVDKLITSVSGFIKNCIADCHHSESLLLSQPKALD